MKNLRILVLSILSILTMTSCASIVSGTGQNVSVDTGNAYGARCTLSNSKGTWYINDTPGSAVVNRSYGNLTVDCKKQNYLNGHKTVASTTKGMAFGNIIFGGVIGAGVDMADGAAYDYPNEIYVSMQKNRMT